MTVQGIVRRDFNAINESKFQNKATGIMPGVVKQVDEVFLQSMLKSTRMEQHFLADSSPFSLKHRETFQDVFDIQPTNASVSVQDIDQVISEQQARIQTPKNIHSLSLPVASIKQFENTNHLATINDFVQSIWPIAKQAGALIGLDPKVLIAQVALETGWGKFVAKDTDGSSSNNLFNIKAGTHSEFDSVQVNTKEYVANIPIKVNASFRKYQSIEDSFNDYISLIKGSKRYQNTLANAENPELYVHELYKAGYATDPDYAKKILAIYHGEELKQAIQSCEISTGI